MTIATTLVAYAGCPTVAPHAASNISTADGGQLPAAWRPGLGRRELVARQAPAERLPDDVDLQA